jgi:hypothetical protein
MRAGLLSKSCRPERALLAEGLVGKKQTQVLRYAQDDGVFAQDDSVFGCKAMEPTEAAQ